MPAGSNAAPAAEAETAAAAEAEAQASTAQASSAGIVLSSFHLDVSEGASGTYTVELAAAPSADVTVDITVLADDSPGWYHAAITVDTKLNTAGNQSTLTFTDTNWSTPQTVTVSAAQDDGDYSGRAALVHRATSTDTSYDGVLAHNAVTEADDDAASLSASLVTATAATLTLANYSSAWWYRQILPSPGTCTSVAAGTGTVPLTGLKPGSEHRFEAFSNATCSSRLTGSRVDVLAGFTTHGVMLSRTNLIAPEGSTASYTVRLSTAPAADVTVTITPDPDADIDTDLTVDTEPSRSGRQNTLTFTTADWDTPKPVTVFAAHDYDGADPAYGSTTFLHAATGYRTSPSKLTVTEGDDDVCSGTVAVGSGASAGLVRDCNTLLAAKAMLAGTATTLDNWATSLDMAQWTGIRLYRDRRAVTMIDISWLTPKINGSIPNTFGDLTKLRQLYLRDTDLWGPLPPELGNLAEVQAVGVADSFLSGPIPPEIGNATTLLSLGVTRSFLSGPIPPELGKLTTLVGGLYLDENQLSGALPLELGNLTKLTSLSFAENRIEGPIPREIGNLTKLNYFLGARNKLSGELPDTLGNLAMRHRLFLTGNMLSGPIPATFGNFTSLTSLALNHNFLQGPIPPELGKLTNVESFYLDNNRLSGLMPETLGSLRNVTALRVGGNRLSGEIPQDLGNLGQLGSLRVLHIHRNQLSGEIAAELDSLSNMEHLFFADSYLSGCMPPNWYYHRGGARQLAGKTLTMCAGMELSDASLEVAEGSTTDYKVRLTTKPSADVTVTVSRDSGDTDLTFDTDLNANGSQDTLTFTPMNWSTAQTVRLSAAQDADAADGIAVLAHTAASSDSDYSGVTTEAAASETDDDVGLNAEVISPTSALLRMSNNAANTNLWWHRRSSPSLGTCSEYPSVASLPALASGLSPNTAYTYKAYSDSTCSTERTSDATDAEFTTPSGLLASHTHVIVGEGASGAFSVKLATAPSANVTVTVARAAGGDSDLTFDTGASGDQSTITFTTVNWATAQDVTVSAAADTDTANGRATLTLNPSSTDAVYNSAPVEVVAVERDDDPALSVYTLASQRATLLLANHTGAWHYKETSGSCLAPPRSDAVAVTLTGLSASTAYTYKAYSDSACSTELTSDATDAEFTTRGGTLTLSASSLSVGEGATATYTVVLGAAPASNVQVRVAAESGSDSDITVSPAALTFTPQNWSTAQTFTVSAAQDADTAAGMATLVHSVNTTATGYLGVTAALVATESDDDAALSASSVTGTTATLKIANHSTAWRYKRTAPTAGSCSAEISAGTSAADVAALTRGTTYTFRAYSDSSCSTELTSDGTDAEFTTADVKLSASSLSVDEDSSAVYTLRLTSAPSAPVTFTVARSAGGDSDIVFDTDSATPGYQSTLTFTADNWGTAQTVTVLSLADNDSDDDSATLTSTAASSDAAYNGESVTVSVAAADDDEPTLTATARSQTWATLTMTFHLGSWYWRQTAPAEGDCSEEVPAGMSSVHVAGLASGQRYTYKAYSDSACTNELTSDDSDAEFVTPLPYSPQRDSGEGGSGSRTARPVRLSGADRYGTAAEAADRFVSLVEDASAAAGARRQVDTVIVASGEAFPDALAASALARTLQAPVLLTPRTRLDPAVQAFITRHRIASVVIVGGPAAVSDDVEDAIAALPEVDSVARHAGADRYSTAALVARAVGAPGNLCGSTTPTVIVTTGHNYPDALVAGPLAYRGRHPIVLAASDRLPEATADYLRTSGAKQAIVVGGLAAVSDDVVAAVEALGLTTSRVSGSDRADTSVQFARRFSAFSGPSCYRKDTVGLATGRAFPDALAASPLLGHYGAPLLLTHPDGVPQPLIDYAASGRLAPDFDQPPIVTAGGRAAVPADHPTKLLAALPR